MKKRIVTLALVSLAFVSCSETKSTVPEQHSEPVTVASATEEVVVPFALLSNYFIKNDFKEADLQGVLITSQAEFEKVFGAAATMGANGKPTAIDFTAQNVIACIGATSDMENKLTVNDVKSVGTSLVVNYSIEEGKKQSFTSRNFVGLLVDKKYTGAVELVKK
jgi:hypothetical protein